jgi:hypothetical protein
MRLLLLLFIAGCSEEGMAIPKWRLDVDGGEIVLPSEYSARVGRVPRFRLRAEVDLPEEWRGRQLELAINYLGTPARLYYDGALATELNHSLARGSTQGWQLQPEHSRVSLELEIDNYSWFASSTGAVPRIGPSLAGYRRALEVNVIAAWIAVVTLLVLSMIHGFAFILDRSRHAHGYYALMALLITPFQLGNVGVLKDPHGRDIVFSFGSAAASALTSLWFVHAAFSLGPPPRFFRFLWLLLGAIAIASRDPFRGPLLIMAATLLIAAFCLTSNIVIVWRREKDRISAILLVLGWLAVLTSLFVDGTIAVGKSHWFGGLLGNPIGLLLFAFFTSLLLGREQALQVRRGRQLHAELRHQVAARSRQLADALSRVSAREVDVGAVIGGRYRLVRPLGAGGMGRVFECERDHQRFALKLMGAGVSPEALSRFAREAKIASELQHENLVAVHDLGVTDEGRFYLVMDLVRGGSLDDKRDRFGDAAWALPILGQIARGIEAVHARGVVHRDLKPANILLEDQRVKIADFGIARLIDGDQDPALQLTRGIVGTPAYLAPELARGSAEARAPADIFSFGVIAYQLVSGELPFESAPLWAQLEGRALARPQPLSLPIGEIIDRCLRFDPSERPTAEELVLKLR